jgi:hypothetical protein
MSDQRMDTAKTEFSALLDEEERAIEIGPDPAGQDQALRAEFTPPDPAASAPVIK